MLDKLNGGLASASIIREATRVLSVDVTWYFAWQLIGWDSHDSPDTVLWALSKSTSPTPAPLLTHSPSCCTPVALSAVAVFGGVRDRIEMACRLEPVTVRVRQLEIRLPANIYHVGLWRRMCLASAIHSVLSGVQDPD